MQAALWVQLSALPVLRSGWFYPGSCQLTRQVPCLLYSSRRRALRPREVMGLPCHQYTVEQGLNRVLSCRLRFTCFELLTLKCWQVSASPDGSEHSLHFPLGVSTGPGPPEGLLTLGQRPPETSSLTPPRESMQSPPLPPALLGERRRGRSQGALAVGGRGREAAPTWIRPGGLAVG